MIASVYMPMKINPPSTEMERVAQYCNMRRLTLILGGDMNAHHFRWGSQECRSEATSSVNNTNTTNNNAWTMFMVMSS